jgi:glucose 1-dehydrogenase
VPEWWIVKRDRTWFAIDAGIRGSRKTSKKTISGPKYNGLSFPIRVDFVVKIIPIGSNEQDMTRMLERSSRLEGRFALVTGGSRGIGRAIAERFAADGAIVAINHYQDGDAAAEALEAVREIDARHDRTGRPHRVVEADIGSPTAIKEMLDGVIDDWKRLDILINNAGIQAATPGDGFDHETFERIIAVNLTGQAYCAEAAIRHFLQRAGGGVIINTTSAHEVIPKPGFLAYSISKGGLGSLTRTLALEFADRGIRVNAVGPGAVMTSMNDGWRHNPVQKANVESHIPMGRAAESDEIAAVYAFLASDDAVYVNGQTIYACGGITLYGDFKQNWAS